MLLYFSKSKIKYIEDLENSAYENSLDSLLMLKEECFRYFNRLDSWLTEGLETQKKKEQLINNCIHQLKKSKE